MNRENLTNAMHAQIKELANYRLTLDADPLASGLSTFNVKIAQAREYTNRVASILTGSIMIKREAQAARDRAKSDFERSLTLLLAQDPRVYEVPEGQRSSVESRRASALSLLKESGNNSEQELAEAEDFLHSANMFYDTAKLVYDNLNETRKDLLYQISVIRTQVAIGEVAADPLITKGMFQGVPLETEIQNAGSVTI